MLTGVRRIGPVYLERRTRSGFGLLVLWIAAAALALAVLTLVLISTGASLRDSFRSIASATFGSAGGLAVTLATSAPLILTGLSVAMARRVGLWNVGGEGQLYLGATCAAALAFSFPSPPRPLLLAAMLAAAAAGGGVWALGPALAKARLRISEIVTGLLFTLAAVLLVGALSRGRWRDPLALGFPLSKSLSENASLPSIPGTSIHLGLVLALGAALVVWLLLTRTPFGRDASPSAEGRGGKESANRTVGEVLLATLAAGALAGAAGMIELVAVAHRLHPDLSPGYGYIGILVAALVRFSPAGVVVVAVPAAALLTAGQALQGLGVDVLVVRIAQGAIVSIAVVAVVLSRFRVERVARRLGIHAPG